MDQNNFKSKGSILDVDVCVVGMGVSSLALVRRLDQQNIENNLKYVVLSQSDFGVWDILYQKGDDFDLISSKAHSAFSWWNYEEDFLFFTATEYYQRLKADLTPSIAKHILREKAVRYRERDDGAFEVYTSFADSSHSEETEYTCPRVVCKHLVITGGLTSNGPKITEMLERSLELKNKTVYIQGYGDSSNMIMARLMLGNNKVIIGSRHFQNVDKLLNLGTKDVPCWAAFDILEEYTYLYQNSQARHMGVANHCTIAPFYNKGLAKLFLMQSGVHELLDVDDFSLPSSYPSPLTGYWMRSGVSAGFGYPVKYWPVDAYFFNYEQFRDYMLQHRILLNDVYFLTQIGKVRVVHLEKVEELSKNKIRIHGKEVIEADIIWDSEQGIPRSVQVELQDEKDWRYEYTDHLHGIWSARRPNLHFVGCERPTTGGFASTSEIQCEFHYRLIVDPSFRDKMIQDYDRNLTQWKYNQLDSGATLPGMKHTQFSGMTNMCLAKLMDADMTFIPSLLRGELLEYMNGTHFPWRYDKLFHQKEKYMEYCKRWTNKTGWIYYWKTLWSILLAIHLIVLGMRINRRGMVVQVGLLLLFPHGQKWIRTLTEHVFSYGEDHLSCHLCGMFSILILLNTCLLFLPRVSTEIPWHWNLSCSGLPFFIPLVIFDIWMNYRRGAFLFNDCRRRKDYATMFEKYLDDVRATDWYQTLQKT